MTLTKEFACLSSNMAKISLFFESMGVVTHHLSRLANI